MAISFLDQQIAIVQASIAAQQTEDTSGSPHQPSDQPPAEVLDENGLDANGLPSYEVCALGVNGGYNHRY